MPVCGQWMSERECPLCAGAGRIDTVVTQDQLDAGRTILVEVANRHEITLPAMLGRSRTVELVGARAEAAKLIDAVNSGRQYPFGIPIQFLFSE